jgi:hypothetical protein
MAAALCIQRFTYAVNDLVKAVNPAGNADSIDQAVRDDIGTLSQILDEVGGIMRDCANVTSTPGPVLYAQVAMLGPVLEEFAKKGLADRRDDALGVLGTVSWAVNRLPRAVAMMKHAEGFLHDYFHAVFVTKSKTSDKFVDEYAESEHIANLLAILGEARGTRSAQDLVQFASASPSVATFLSLHYKFKIDDLIVDKKVVEYAPHFVARVHSSRAAAHVRCTSAAVVLNEVAKLKDDALSKRLDELYRVLDDLEGVESHVMGPTNNQLDWLAAALGVRDRVRRILQVPATVAEMNEKLARHEEAKIAAKAELVARAATLSDKEKGRLGDNIKRLDAEIARVGTIVGATKKEFDDDLANPKARLLKDAGALEKSAGPVWPVAKEFGGSVRLHHRPGYSRVVPTVPAVVFVPPKTGSGGGSGPSYVTRDPMSIISPFRAQLELDSIDEYKGKGGKDDLVAYRKAVSARLDDLLREWYHYFEAYSAADARALERFAFAAKIPQLEHKGPIGSRTEWERHVREIENALSKGKPAELTSAEWDSLTAAIESYMKSIYPKASRKTAGKKRTKKKTVAAAPAAKGRTPSSSDTDSGSDAD